MQFKQLLNYCFKILISVLFIRAKSFVFRQIQVLPASRYVGSITSYTLFADRSMDQFFYPTPWDSEPVATDAIVTIQFPNEYQLLNQIICETIIISTFTQTYHALDYSFSPDGDHQFRVHSIFLQSQRVSNIIIILSNVLNPSPALITGCFFIQIGNDRSSSQYTSSIVILEPAPLASVAATFDPKTVNTTGFLILSFISVNIIPKYSELILTLPGSTWANDISPSHNLLVNGIICVGLSSNIQSAITCSSNSLLNQIMVSNIADRDIPANSQISLKVGPLFSPPTQHPADILQLYVASLYQNSYYNLNSASFLISGLEAKTLIMSVTSANLIVNKEGPLIFSILLSDTINQKDCFWIYLPSEGTINYSDVSVASNIAVQSKELVQNQLGKYLKITQKSSPQRILFANREVMFYFSYYKAPTSTKQLIFKVEIKRNGLLMAQGLTKLNVLPNMYSGVLQYTDLIANHVSNYTLRVEVKDDHASSMMIQIQLPENLKINKSTFKVTTSLSKTVSPKLQISSSVLNTIRLSKLSEGASDITAQSISIELMMLINPSGAIDLGNFTVRTYYTQNIDDLVSQSIIDSLLTTSFECKDANCYSCVDGSSSGCSQCKGGFSYDSIKYTKQVELIRNLLYSGSLILSIMIKNILLFLFQVTLQIVQMYLLTTNSVQFMDINYCLL